MNNNNIEYIILDTETTGLGSTASIVEISAVDNLGRTVIDSLVNPGFPIPKEATAIHGITDAMVASAPTFDNIYPQLLDLLKYPCYIYNKGYDTKLIKQSAAQYGIEFDIGKYEFRCTMLAYSNKHSPEKWAKLSVAYQHALAYLKLEPAPLKAHRALADCVMTLQVINFLEQERKDEEELQAAKEFEHIQEQIAQTIQSHSAPKFYQFNPNAIGSKHSGRFTINRNRSTQTKQLKI